MEMVVDSNEVTAVAERKLHLVQGCILWTAWYGMHEMSINLSARRRSVNDKLRRV